jgi:peptidoglycan/xylan/chitin deacetylase (PgdA/CDA1 family)
MDRKIHVLITMDVEPALPADRPPASTGPLNYADSERFIRGYARMAADYGYPVSFMIHPEVTGAHPDLMLELEGEGACLGLHVHPWKFADGHYKAHFGGLSAERQYAILSEATEMWRDGLGKRPRYFRPGTFSANDSTFAVLDHLGFLGGSVSLPGRVYPDMNAVWAGAEYDPHRANAVFRQVPGDLDFVNIPLSVDISRTEDRDGRKFHWDLRPDWQAADYHRIARNIVEQVIARAPRVRVLHMVTHNDNDFSNPDDRVRKNYATVLRELTGAIRAAGGEPAGATFASVADLVRGASVDKGNFVYAHASMLTG